ncbi:MAG TPA: galactokinase [Gaiellaceae bacterium]|nr:galactokinase [Gaiellaceae bacterium]
MRVGLLERLLRVVPDAEQAFRAPGRANLIGEHTDYNDGFVLPAALELATYVAGRRRDDGLVSVRSLDGEIDEHVDAVRRALRDDEVEIAGFEGVVASDIPIGAGLSSSAALEVALACALSVVALEPRRLAAVCHRAENVYLGTRSGIMDQLVSAAGEAGHALLIDCRDLTVTPIAVPRRLSLLVVDSGVRRELAESAYNERVAECRAAADALGVSSLRDVTSLDGLTGVLLRRARHVVEENRRVLAAAEALRSERLDELGSLFRASHESLTWDFDVSTPELDRLVALAEEADGVIAARLTGAGFGGCTINLVLADAAQAAGRDIVTRYASQTGREARFWISKPGPGAGPVPL